MAPNGRRAHPRSKRKTTNRRCAMSIAALRTLWGCFKARNQLISMLEMAEFETDPVERRRLLTIAVAGGNFGGVEVPKEIREFLVKLARREYRGIDVAEIRVVLISGSDHIRLT